MKRLAALSLEIEDWQKLSQRATDALELARLEDKSLEVELKAELQKLEAIIERREFTAMLSGKYDRGDALLARIGPFRPDTSRTGAPPRQPTPACVEPRLVEIPLPGRHNLYNALAALGTAWRLGVDWPSESHPFRDLRLPPGRVRLEEVGGVVLIDDTYNASPPSMEAALALLSRYPEARRRVAVLGDMLELGACSADLHRNVGRNLAHFGIDLFLATGTGMGHAVREARCAGIPAARAIHCEDLEGVVWRLRPLLRPGDVILFKGSRGMGLERALAALREHLRRRDDGRRPEHRAAPAWGAGESAAGSESMGAVDSLGVP